MKDIDYKSACIRLYSRVQELYSISAAELNNLSECKIKTQSDNALGPDKVFDAKIVVAVANGFNALQIGESLDRSHRTVEAHLKNLRRKYGAVNTYQLVAIFFRNGWIK